MWNSHPFENTQNFVFNWNVMKKYTLNTFHKRVFMPVLCVCRLYKKVQPNYCTFLTSTCLTLMTISNSHSSLSVLRIRFMLMSRVMLQTTAYGLKIATTAGEKNKTWPLLCDYSDSLFQFSSENDMLSQANIYLSAVLSLLRFLQKSCSRKSWWHPVVIRWVISNRTLGHII